MITIRKTYDKNMNLRDLKCLIIASETGNFTKAAERCHVSQPALSNQIKKIEEFFGVQIFERSNKNVIVTEIGAEIINSARQILFEMANMKEMAKIAQNPFTGFFKLGAFPTLANYIFPKIAAKITEKLPQLKLFLIEEKTDILLNKLKSGDIDAALLALPIEDDALISKKLFVDEFLLAVPKNYPIIMKQKFLNIEDLEGMSLLLLDEGHCLRNQALEVCFLNKIKEEPNFRATSLETLRIMVKSGLGVTLMPKIAIHPNERDIKYIHFKNPPSRTIALVYRKTSVRVKLMEAIAKLF